VEIYAATSNMTVINGTIIPLTRDSSISAGALTGWLLAASAKYRNRYVQNRKKYGLKITPASRVHCLSLLPDIGLVLNCGANLAGL
jgi:hypothetical protein